jgi:D-3-phosphoglycerate dehydrogenase
MVNKSRNEVAYNIIDVEGDISDEILQKVGQVEGVIRVRAV